MDYTPFPLTPALSPRERENRHPVFEDSSASDWSKRDSGDSLSPGERGGVRGKDALDNQGL